MGTPTKPNRAGPWRSQDVAAQRLDNANRYHLHQARLQRAIRRSTEAGSFLATAQEVARLRNVAAAARRAARKAEA